MSNRQVDAYLAHEHYVGEVACCECGFHRGGQHHPKIRCPKSGRCGDCGNDWPCAEHAPKRAGKPGRVVVSVSEDPVGISENSEMLGQDDRHPRRHVRSLEVEGLKFPVYMLVADVRKDDEEPFSKLEEAGLTSEEASVLWDHADRSFGEPSTRFVHTVTLDRWLVEKWGKDLIAEKRAPVIHQYTRSAEKETVEFYVLMCNRKEDRR